MLLSTPGLVLHTTPYGESSVIVKVFTRLLGLRSYIIKGVRQGRSRTRQNMLQPLNSLDMVVYDSPRTTLNHVKELAPRHPATMPDPVADALRFFVAEVLYKALHENEPMPDYYDYVEQLDFHNPEPAFPIAFLLHTTHHLGIAPMDNHTQRTPLFHLQEGRFTAVADDITLDPGISYSLHTFLAAIDNGAPLPPTPYSERMKLLNALLAYLHIHLGTFVHFHSHEVLHAVLAP